MPHSPFRIPARQIALLSIAICIAPLQAKKPKTQPEQPKDEISVVGHVAVSGAPISRFLSTKHYSSYYLYAEREAGKAATLLDITDANRPSVLADVAYAPSGESDSLSVVVGTAALVTTAGTPAAAAPQTIRIMDFSDPKSPKVAREFTGVTAFSRDDPRGLMFVANGEGIWILYKRIAEDPAVNQAYADYVLMVH